MSELYYERLRILSINMHTGWHYMLSKVGLKIDIPLNLGEGWNFENRPLPDNFNLIKDFDVFDYDIIILHSVRELKLITKIFFSSFKFVSKKKKKLPRIILVIHGRSNRQSKSIRTFVKILLLKFIEFLSLRIPLDIVFITPCVKASWVTTNGIVIKPGIPIEKSIDYSNIANRIKNKELIITANNISRSHFSLNFLESVPESWKITIVGNNPIIINKPNITYFRPKNYEEYLNIISSGFFYLSLLKEPEEGFNLSLLEAMSLGVPVIALKHPTSPIISSHNGFVFETSEELLYILKYINKIDFETYIKLCMGAIDTINTQFNIKDFVDNWQKLIFKYEI